MKTTKSELLSKADVSTKKRILKVLAIFERIEEQSAILIEGLQVIIHLLEHKESAKVIPINRSKTQEFRESWLDKQEVMQMMPISERSLYSLRKQGDLPSYRFKGKVYFKLSDVEALMRGGSEGSGIAV